MESSAIDIERGCNLGNDACKSLFKENFNLLENEFFNDFDLTGSNSIANEGLIIDHALSHLRNVV